MTGPHVLHVVPNLFGDAPGGLYGGAERYAYEMAQTMARHTPTTLLGFADRTTVRRTPEGLVVRSLGPAWRVRGQAHNPLHPRLLRHIAAADVVHCHQTHLLTHSLTALVGRVAGRPVFTTELGGGGWDVSAYISTAKWFAGHLHISDYSRRINGHDALPTAQVIYGGIDTERFSPPVAVVEREPLIVFVGRLMPHKGVDAAIRSLPPGLTLEILGRPYHAQYAADLTALAVGKRVVFRANASDGDIVQAYRRARAVVLPSLFKDLYGNESVVPELLGQTALEGMACGAPAVVTEVASLPEVVVDGVTGFIVPPHDDAAMRTKFEWLRDHPAGAAALGAAARTHVLEKFHWPAVVRKCLAAYVVALGGRCVRRRP